MCLHCALTLLSHTLTIDKLGCVVLASQLPLRSSQLFCLHDVDDVQTDRILVQTHSDAVEAIFSPSCGEAQIPEIE